jgi:hypothetical protein
MWEVWGFLIQCDPINLWGMLLGIPYKNYYLKRYQDSSTNNVTVKKDDSSKLTRFQDSVWLKCVILAEYNWEYLIEEKNCKLMASFGVFFYIDFFLFFCCFNFLLGSTMGFLVIKLWYSRSLSHQVF